MSRAAIDVLERAALLAGELENADRHANRHATMLEEARARHHRAHADALEALASLAKVASETLVCTRDEWTLPADALETLREETRSCEHALVALARAHDVLTALELLR